MRSVWMELMFLITYIKETHQRFWLFSKEEDGVVNSTLIVMTLYRAAICEVVNILELLKNRVQWNCRNNKEVVSSWTPTTIILRIGPK